MDSTCFFVDIHSGVVDDKVESVGSRISLNCRVSSLMYSGPLVTNEVGIVGAVVMIETDDGQIELFDAREPVDDLSGATAAVRAGGQELGLGALSLSGCDCSESKPIDSAESSPCPLAA